MIPLLTSTKLTRTPRHRDNNNCNINENYNCNNDNTIRNFREKQLDFATQLIKDKNNNNFDALTCQSNAASPSSSSSAAAPLSPEMSSVVPIPTSASQTSAPSFITSPSLSSLTTRIGEKLSTVADRISNRLMSSSRGSDQEVTGKTAVAETLYPDQCAEKASLLMPTFVDESYSVHGGSSPFLSAAAAASLSSPDEERQCRICLLSTPSVSNNPLEVSSRPSYKRRIVAPCRCAGTVQYVHIGCLTHWIEVSSRKMQTVPSCELCGFRFRRKPFIDLRRLHFPYVDWCDRILNILFLFLIIIMMLCAWVAVHYLCLSEKRPLIRPSRNANTKRFLTDNDVTVIIASILFFAAFFIALFTQYRAEVTVFRILARLWATNRNWRIRDYDARVDDALFGEEIVGGVPSKLAPRINVVNEGPTETRSGQSTH